MSRETLQIAIIGVAVLSLMNVMIWDKERVREHGEVIYLELAPVDPRSLIQGDYMRLDYEVTRQAESQFVNLHDLPIHDETVVVRLDERRIARFARLVEHEDATTLAVRERALTIKHDRQGSHIGPESFFFQEGARTTYERARFAEVRITEQGDFLLIALCDSDLQRLEHLEGPPAR